MTLRLFQMDARGIGTCKLLNFLLIFFSYLRSVDDAVAVESRSGPDNRL